MRRFMLLFVLALFAGTAGADRLDSHLRSVYSKTPDDFPEARKRIGQVFVLREMSDSLKKYQYRFSKEPRIGIEKIDYDKYRGQEGKVIDLVAGETGRFKKFYWLVEFGDGTRGYAEWLPLVPEYIEGTYFKTDMAVAEKLVGHSVWVIKKQRPLATPAPDKTVEIKHLEKVTVIGIDTIAYGHGYGVAPFWLRIKTDDGREALVAYDARRSFHSQNPFQKSWKPAIVEAIRNQQVIIGMTTEQTRLALGEPMRINRTVTATGATEQWVYRGLYVYMDNGKVRAFQDSH